MSKVGSRRLRPHEEGAAPGILKLFLEPMLKLRPEHLSPKEWLEVLFGTKDRDVVQLKAKKEFRLPGLLLAAPNVGLQGLGYRWVRMHHPIYARFDLSFPNEIHIEYNNPEEQTFLLSQSEWNSVMPFFEVVEWDQKEQKKQR